MNAQFRAWAKIYGGSFEPTIDGSIVHYQAEHILKRFNLELDFIKGQFKDQNITGVNIAAGFFLNLGLSSRTKSINGFDMIGVDVGLITKLHDIFSHISTVSTILNTYDANLDLQRASMLPSDPDRFVGLGILEGFHSNDILNIVELTSTVVRYIMHHELAHIWNGHLSWSSSIVDRNDVDDIEVSNIRRAFEFDADNRASTAILTLSPVFENRFSSPMLGGQKMRLFSTYSRKLDNTVTIETTIHRHICCIYIAMRIQSQKIGVFLEGAQHPSMSDRIIWMINNYFLIFGKGTNLLEDRVALIILDAVRRCESVISMISKEDSFDPLDKINYQHAIVALDSAKRTWDINRHIFEKHKRGVNLPCYHTDTDNYAEHSKALEIMTFCDTSDIKHNPIPQFDVDADYYVQRIVRNSKFCFSHIKPKSANFPLDKLNGILSDMVGICCQLDHSDENKFLELWVNYLIAVKKFEEFMTNHMSKFEEWTDSWKAISTFDGLIDYIIYASSLDLEEQKNLIKKKPIPVHKVIKDQLNYADVVNIDGRYWPKDIYCFTDISSNHVRIAPGTNFTVKFDMNIGIVRVGLIAALPYFVIRGEQAKLFHIDVSYNKPNLI